MNNDISTTENGVKYGYLESPVGTVEIAATEQGIRHIYFVEQPKQAGGHPQSDSVILKSAKQQLSQYFAGERQDFDLPLAPIGTDFQQQVWQALRTIAYGKTCSYGDIARQINNQKAVRAVGAANGKNPLSIVVPCHRVIGKSGKLTGYAGGLSRKAWLLQLESQQSDLF